MSDWRALYEFDRAAARGRAAGLVGVDEAGRGPLAGPVVAAAVVLDLDAPIEYVNDSKKLGAARRAALYERITRSSVAWAAGVASVEEIDKRNILQAALLAMHRAVEQIACGWSLALVDGNRAIPWLPAERQWTVVQGDARSASVAAASIVAKVTRDRMMERYDAEYPGYGFARHKGYGTAMHIARIRERGLCHIHRRTFCDALAAQTTLGIEP